MNISTFIKLYEDLGYKVKARTDPYSITTEYTIFMPRVFSPLKSEDKDQIFLFRKGFNNEVHLRYVFIENVSE